MNQLAAVGVATIDGALITYNDVGSEGFFPQNLNSIQTWTTQKKFESMREEFRDLLHTRSSPLNWINVAGGSMVRYLGLSENLESWRSAASSMEGKCAVCNKLRTIVDSVQFSSLVVILTVLNAFFIAIVSDHSVKTAFRDYSDRAEYGIDATSPSRMLWHEVTNVVFSAAFAL